MYVYTYIQRNVCKHRHVCMFIKYLGMWVRVCVYIYESIPTARAENWLYAIKMSATQTFTHTGNTS